MLTDVPGIRVGHAQRLGDGWATGVTVVLPPVGTVGAVDVRGGGPGTHETDALAPGTLVDVVHAVALCGGSAYGLVAAHGVQRWCEEHGLGYPVGGGLLVPIVPAAAIFDLGRGGDPTARPDEAMGYDATANASTSEVARGRVGAGTGARSSRGAGPGGVGTATVRLPGGVIVSALVVLNAAGGVLGRAGEPAGGEGDAALATTLAVVATNARLDVAAGRRMAGAGHDGLARAISPVHTLMDGDTVFTLATGELECAAAAPGAEAAALLGLATVQAAAADAVRDAVFDAWEQGQN